MRTMLLAALAACGAVEPAVDEASWSLDEIVGDSVLRGVWGSGPQDVWVVGGSSDHSIVLHSDGTRWTRFDTPGTGLLSNVYGFSDSDVYAVGEGGLLLHYDGQTWTRVESGTTMPLFGLWGASGDDVWIAGGDVAGPAGSAVLLRGSRDTFATIDLPAEVAPKVLYKVHGFAADDVMLVGSTGVLRYDGLAWGRDAIPITTPLFSAWGRDAHDVYAVGGDHSGEILHSDGRQWSVVDRLPTGTSLYGVFTSPDAPTIAVGANSSVFEIGEGGEVVQAKLPELDPPPFLHGVWGDGYGTTYVVGGNLSADQPAMGVIFRRTDVSPR